MKESFILYVWQKEMIDKLSNEDAGKLIKAIYQYVATDEMPKLDGLLDMVVIPFKQSLDMNNAKWQDIKQKRSEAGKKGMEVRWKEKNITNIANVTDVISDNKNNKLYQDITNITNDIDVITDDKINEMSDEEFIKYLEKGKK